MSGSVPILVVEDERTLRRLIRTSLAAHGYRVLEAGTGRAAIETVAAGDPEVVLLDLGLPDMDGLEVIRKVRAGGAKTPIIVLSSRGDERGKVSALDLGADDYVTKPFGMASSWPASGRLFAIASSRTVLLPPYSAMTISRST